MKLSAVVITYNEAQNIERCLKSLSFCDEIVVIDSQSQDNTRELALKYTSKVFTKPWRGYAAQKNDAISLASFDWVLSVDADEEVTPALKQEILSVIQDNDFSGFLILKTNF